MGKKDLYTELFPFIYYAMFIISYIFIQFLVIPFIMSVFLPSESFDYPSFALLLLALIMLSIPYFSHQITNKKIQKEGKVCFAQVIGKSKFTNIEGITAYFHAVGTEDDKEFDFHLQIYPFTKTKIGNSYLIHYSGSEKKNKCFIMEDEKLLSKLFYYYAVIHFCVAVVLSFLV